MNKNKKTKVKRRKQFGLYLIEGSLYAMASSNGEIEDKELIEKRILFIKDKLKREMLRCRIMIKDIENSEDIDKIPSHRKITIFLNPYYELEVVKNLKPFPVDMDNKENIEWINNIDTYLAMHFLYYREFNKPMASTKDFKFTNREIMEAKEILFDYYDLENPKKNILEVEDRYIYYHPKKDLIRNAKKDIAEYETALVAKVLASREDVTIDNIEKETGFDKHKIAPYLNQIIVRGEKDLIRKAKKLVTE